MLWKQSDWLFHVFSNERTAHETFWMHLPLSHHGNSKETDYERLWLRTFQIMLWEQMRRIPDQFIYAEYRISMAVAIELQQHSPAQFDDTTLDMRLWQWLAKLEAIERKLQRYWLVNLLEHPYYIELDQWLINLIFDHIARQLQHLQELWFNEVSQTDWQRRSEILDQFGPQQPFTYNH